MKLSMFFKRHRSNKNDEIIKPCDFVTLITEMSTGEAGARVISQTKPITETQKRAYEALAKVFNICLNEIRPSVSKETVDQLARQIIAEAGYRENGYWNFKEELFWIHRDSWQPWRGTAAEIFQENMVLSLEPSLKVANINAYVLMMPIMTRVADIIKVGGMLRVTNNGNELFGDPPPKTAEAL